MFQIQNRNGRKFNLRLVRMGDRYGLNMCLTHKDEQGLGTMVEFYDDTHRQRPEFAPLGQFVSRYYISTLLDEKYGPKAGVGLDLCGHEPVWKVDGEAMDLVRAYLQGVIEGEPARAALREAVADGVDAVQYALAKFRQGGTQWWVEGEAFLDKAKALGLANVTEV